MRLRPMFAVIGICLLLAGCTAQQGLRSLASASSSMPASTTSVSVSATSSQRLRVPEIRQLFAYAACELLGRDQLDGIAPGVYGSPGVDPAYDADTCTYTTGGTTWVIRAVSQNIRDWDSGARKGTTTEIGLIAGYPGVLVEIPGEHDRCNIAVMVTASGNYLLITVDGAAGAVFPDPCDGARRIASAATETLAAKNAFDFRTKASTSRPPAPRIDLHRISPCTLLDAGTVRALGGQTVGLKGRESEEVWFHTPSCIWIATGASLWVNVVPDSGLIGYDHTPEKFARQENFMPSRLMELPPVRRYPTFLARGPRSTATECELVVDVADDQMLRAIFDVSASFVDRFVEPCEGARRLVDAALATVTS